MAIDRDNLKNMDINIDMASLENINIDINKDILENVDVDKGIFKISISIEYCIDKNLAYRTPLGSGVPDWAGRRYSIRGGGFGSRIGELSHAPSSCHSQLASDGLRGMTDLLWPSMKPKLVSSSFPYNTFLSWNPTGPTVLLLESPSSSVFLH